MAAGSVVVLYVQLRNVNVAMENMKIDLAENTMDVLHVCVGHAQWLNVTVKEILVGIQCTKIQLAMIPTDVQHADVCAVCNLE